jgi:hypothetical protein
MAYDLQALYQRFDACFVRLQTDVREAIRDLPPEKAGAFYWKSPNFAEFERFWRRVQGDAQLVQRWTRRLSATGYDEERSAIRARLECSCREGSLLRAPPAAGLDKAA